MSHRLVAGSAAAAAIWILVKLPQEYWIHIAELDVTDEQARHPWLLPVFFSGCAVVIAVVALFRSGLPAWDRTPAIDVDATIDRPPSSAVVPRRDMNAILSAAVFEKVLLLAMVTVSPPLGRRIARPWRFDRIVEAPVLAPATEVAVLEPGGRRELPPAPAR